ncbi:MAG: sigma-70 family RNA polymerase sigma factor, partial [Solirubrobacterales bacterium]|nr:sigma-70 family RNA polymerase sigma factor [Solirubrobacterales bacterium]
MDDRGSLTERFEQHRPHLRAVAYRMLGSVSDADDALQEAWLRSREQTERVENMQAWLTMVVSRVCLNMLRSRRARREEPSVHIPDPVVSFEEDGPEQEALLGNSVGLALLVVLDALTPAERLAFVLHDVFGVPFTE